MLFTRNYKSVTKKCATTVIMKRKMHALFGKRKPAQVSGRGASRHIKRVTMVCSVAQNPSRRVALSVLQGLTE